MSSQKTGTYHLHIWEAGDDFLRTEFNENFAAIDGAIAAKADGAATAAALAGKVEMVAGAYVGDDAVERTIDLGFTPQMVEVVRSDSCYGNSGATYGGFAVAGHPTKRGSSILLEVIPNGFRIRRSGLYNGSYDLDANRVNSTYHYLALK